MGILLEFSKVSALSAFSPPRGDHIFNNMPSSEKTAIAFKRRRLNVIS